MKIEISQKTLRDLGTLKGRWLLRNKDIHIIREFQYVVEKPEPIQPKRFRRKRVDTAEKIYLTSIRIEGYKTDLKFVGNYGNEYCEVLIAEHNHPYERLDLFDFAARWVYVNDQIIALQKFEEDLKQDREETELKEVIELLIEGKPLNATKKYIEVTGASFKDAKEYVLHTLKPKYCEV